MMFKILLILLNSFDLVQKPIETITTDNMNSEIIQTMFRLRHNEDQIAVNSI